jgi:ribonuclease PH
MVGERTLTIDCDVLQADGGTRTAAITGAYVALCQAFATLARRKELRATPLKCGVASTSVGVVNGMVLLDLNYEEDFRAEVDFNVVMTDSGEFVELQGTAENGSFSKDTLDLMLASAGSGIERLFELQREVTKSF